MNNDNIAPPVQNGKNSNKQYTSFAFRISIKEQLKVYLYTQYIYLYNNVLLIVIY